MKYLIVIMFSLFVTVVHAETKKETKKVCHDVAKNGRIVKQCRIVKIHKKVEGTPIPEKK
jgi:hypothetical protein